MVWHIFKKDWILLWWLVAASAALHAVLAAARFRLGQFADIRALVALGGPPGSLLLFLVTAFLIVVVVHQDAIPGVRQDWLVRPIRRIDLILAKFLFVLVMVHAPMLAADLLQGVANGFSLGQSAGAALATGAYVLAGFSVPMLAFAALTRNLTEVVVGLTAALGVVVAILILPHLIGRGASPTALTGAGRVRWRGAAEPVYSVSALEPRVCDPTTVFAKPGRGWRRHHRL